MLSVLDSKKMDVFKEIIEKVLNSEENIIFSPTALYLALIILTKMTDGDTKSQILRTLKLKENETEEFYAAVSKLEYSDCSAESHMALSLWMNDRLEYDKNLLSQLNEKYKLLSFSGKMGTHEMDQRICEWMEMNSKNMVNGKNDIKTEPDTLLEQLNTIYFRSKWIEEFDDFDTRSGSFYRDSGNDIRCEMMNQQIQTTYHKGDRFAAVTKLFYEGYEGIFILPNKGVKTSDLAGDVQLHELISSGRLPTSEEYDVDLTMPKYDISSKIDFKKIMKSLGIRDVFDSNNADFTPLTRTDHVYLSKIQQTARIKVDEQGIEAAACAECLVIVAGIPPKLKKVKFKLNRPFLFVIRYKDALPVFVGKVENPSGSSSCSCL